MQDAIDGDHDVLDMGADINAVNVAGDTAAHVAGRPRSFSSSPTTARRWT